MLIAVRVRTGHGQFGINFLDPIKCHCDRQVDIMERYIGHACICGQRIWFEADTLFAVEAIDVVNPYGRRETAKAAFPESADEVFEKGDHLALVVFRRNPFCERAVRLSHLPHVKIGHPVLVEGTSPQLFEVVPLVAIADIASEHPDSPRRLAVVKIAADKGNQALLRARSAATRVSGRFHSYSRTNRAIALTRRTAGDQLLRPLAMP